MARVEHLVIISTLIRDYKHQAGGNEQMGLKAVFHHGTARGGMSGREALRVSTLYCE